MSFSQVLFQLLSLFTQVYIFFSKMTVKGDEDLITT